jgi:hypothetical protein
MRYLDRVFRMMVNEQVRAQPSRSLARTAHEEGRTHLRLSTARPLSKLAEHHGLHTEMRVFRGLIPAAAPPRLAQVS